MSGKLFQLRKDLNATVTHDQERDLISDHETSRRLSDDNVTIDTLIPAGEYKKRRYANSKILTENDQYIVQEYKASVHEFNAAEYVRGEVNSDLGLAAINDGEHFYAWNFCSPQKETRICKIPLPTVNAESSRMAAKSVLCWPAAAEIGAESSIPTPDGQSIPAGACIVTPDKKLVYYNDLKAVNNLYTQLSQSMALTVDLKLGENEYVELIHNSEPAGLLITTNNGRVLFVTIRDASGKSKLKVQYQLVKAHTNFFLRHLFQVNEIVSLKNGQILGKGEREIFITYSNGDFSKWIISINGSCREEFKVNVFNSVIQSLQDLYPFASSSLKILDSHPLSNRKNTPVMILSSITNGKEMYYILSTIVFDDMDHTMTVFSTYRLNTYTTPYSEKSKPKLVILTDTESQDNLTNVVVIFSKTVILTKVSSKLDSSYTLKRKWEDLISFRDDIDFVGCGRSKTSVYLIMSTSGLIEIHLLNPTNIQNDFEVNFVKSHVDQAIYFSNRELNPVEFSLPRGIFLETKEIETDVQASAYELFSNTSRYVPPSLNTPNQHLSLRIDLFKKLLEYIKNHFNYNISPNTKLRILGQYEIMCCALKFYDGLKSSSNDHRSIIDPILSPYVPSSPDMLGELITNHLNKFSEVFSQFMEQTIVYMFPSRPVAFKVEIMNLIIDCLEVAVLNDGEDAIRFTLFELDNHECDSSLPWFINETNFNALNQLFFDFKFSIGNSAIQYSNHLLSLDKLLYYYFSLIQAWYSKYSKEKELYMRLKQIFMNNHIAWNHALCDIKLIVECMQITEFYEDIDGLIHVLEFMKGDDSSEYYEHYFEKFGKAFAYKLFSFYISEHELENLFYKFPNHQDLLTDYFKDHRNSDEVYWIKQIFDGNYGGASDTLLKISTNDQYVGKPIDKLLLQLNTSKLSALAQNMNSNPTADDIEHIDNLSVIQYNLDMLDGQVEFQQELLKRKDNIANCLAPRYRADPFSKIFFELGNEVLSNKTIRHEQIIDLYTMMYDSNAFYFSLKLIAFEGDHLAYDMRQALICNVWRRLILLDSWSEEQNNSETGLFKVLLRYFDNDLYKSNCNLPSFRMLADRSLVTIEILQQLYGHIVSPQEIMEALNREAEQIKSLGSEFGDRIKSIIGTANELSGKRIAIDYSDL